MSTEPPLSRGLASRPGSRPETPGIILEGREGLGGLEFDFAISLDIALLHVQKREEEEGKEATFKRRSEEDIWKNAWSTPTWWSWTANDSYVSTGCTTPTLSDEPEQDLTFSPPRAWTLIRNKMNAADTPPSVVSDTPDHLHQLKGNSPSINKDKQSDHCPRKYFGTRHTPVSMNESRSWSLDLDQINSLNTSPPSESYSHNHSLQKKRKLQDHEDQDDRLHPIKRSRPNGHAYSHEPAMFINELTPPITPPSRDVQSPIKATTGHKNSAQVVRQASHRKIACPRLGNKDDTTSHCLARQSRRLRNLPP